ncbi:MAG: hypothetical protein JXQ87_15785 [Bacteroidia bacterium]
MTELEVKELEEIFSTPLKYYYYRDKFLIDRLIRKRACSNELKVQDIKGTFTEKLLQKEWFVNSFLAKSNKPIISVEGLEHYWPENTIEFEISVSSWGEIPKKHRKDKWLQTSRSGYNLVLQVNLNQEHLKLYNSWLKPKWHGEGIFNCTCHPVSEKDITLGWIRLDIDFVTSEVLIEEIQTDWVREVNSLAKNLKVAKNENIQKILRNEGIQGSLDDFWKYFNYLKPVSKIWDELFLSVAIWFSKIELGIDNLWMHTFESCLLFKDQIDSKPPKSLYSKLPKRMGFEVTDNSPEFLKNEVYLKRYFRKAEREKTRWYRYYE